MRKKLFTFLLALATSVGVSYAAPDDSGSCGANVTYSFNGATGEMTITGIGSMTNFESTSDAPWYSYKNDITSVTITDGVTSVGSRSFGYYGNLVTVTIGNDVESIGYYAFGDCYKFTTLNLGNSVKHIGDRAFMWAKVLTGFTLPSTLETIGKRAFLQNKVITSLTIPSNVTSIGDSAFFSCAALTSITTEATTPPTLGSSVFENVPTSIPLYVPNGSVAAYEAAAQWTAFNIQGYDPAPGGGSADVIPCTAADRGKVLCTDGSIYATVSEATAASKTAAAVITYVDTENGKALGLALADESGTMDWETAKTTAAAHTPAVSGGTWTLPSKDDWNNMINAAGGYAALLNGFSAVGGTNIQEAWYWTSTEYDLDAFACRFDNGVYIMPYPTENPCNVRACLAFDIPAAVNITAYQDPQHTDVYYATFFDKLKKYALPNDGTEAYAAEVSGDALLLHKIAEGNDVLPENTAVIFKAPSETITLTQSDDAPVTVTATNNLHGVDAETDVPTGDHHIYVLSGEGGVVGFYAYTGAKLGAHKAYIDLDAQGAAKAPRRLVFHTDEEQGIEDVQNAVQSTKLIENGQLVIIKNGIRYNAQGQELR